MKKAIFWDRDGTLIEHARDSYYTVLPEHITLKPFFEKIAVLQEDYLFFIVTNGGGVGRGWYTEAQFWAGQKYFEALAAEKNVKFLACEPSFWNAKNPENFPEYKDLRKPSPKLVEKICQNFGPIDLQNSFVVGDSNYDMKLGDNVGCRKIFIQDQDNAPEYTDIQDIRVDAIVPDLQAVVNFVKKL
jgi:histidinol-phosphate phosphatase family protein